MKDNKIEQYLLDAIKNLKSGKTQEAHIDIDRARDEYNNTVLIPAFNSGKKINPDKDPILTQLENNNKDIAKGDLKEAQTSILRTIDAYGQFLTKKFNETAVFHYISPPPQTPSNTKPFVRSVTQRHTTTGKER